MAPNPDPTASAITGSTPVNKECYFPNKEKEWLSELIQRVSSSVSNKIQHEKVAAKQRRAARHTQASLAAEQLRAQAHPFEKFKMEL